MSCQKKNALKIDFVRKNKFWFNYLFWFLIKLKITFIPIHLTVSFTFFKSDYICVFNMRD